MIIGITGTIGAGKGTIVEYLKKRGFEHYSVRDFLVREIKRRGMPINRDSMVIVANDLRAAHSPSFIVEDIYSEAHKSGQDCVIESIRTPGEVDSLRSKDNFMLLAVDADPKVRYDRIVKRGSETDKISFEEFKMNEEREMRSDDPAKQNIGKVMEMADCIIENSGSFEKLYEKVEGILCKVSSHGCQNRNTI